MTKFMLVGVILHHFIVTSLGRNWALDVLDEETYGYSNLEILNIASSLGLLGIH